MNYFTHTVHFSSAFIQPLSDTIKVVLSCSFPNFPFCDNASQVIISIKMHLYATLRTGMNKTGLGISPNQQIRHDTIHCFETPIEIKTV